MRTLVSCLALLLAPSAVIAEEIPGSRISYGNWSGAGYTYDDGTFSHCAVSAAYRHGNTLLFSVNTDATVNVGVIAPSDTFTPQEEFPVALFVDRRPPFFGNATALDNTFAVLNISDLERALDSFRRGRTLIIQSKFGETPFDLTGTTRALAATFDCAVRNHAYRAAQPQQPRNQVDPAILMQVAAGTITTLGVSDFTFLSAAEMKEAFPNADPSLQSIFWRSPNLGLLSGVVVAARGPESDLKAGDANDLAMLSSMCSGDFVTGVRQVPEAEVDMREIRAGCTDGSAVSEHYLTKFFLGDMVVYSWLWFEGSKAQSERAPARNEMSKSVALYTASFLSE
ncbi:hypothetical protein [Defluviimonas sp. WL0075]|uniref:Uncharacterized protein n=1 Tax=Albidovulum sediminicola TaxID=2984331 RepID=A0ABT2Z710_9RHOB|nr:hypothetical protein [Defluviimonas sp. WL0075]MCV2866919.1 hypothetical protein [Defluviimonas sp. WL0075]